MTYSSWMAAIGPSEPCYYDAIVEMDSVDSMMANVASYDDWFPDEHQRSIVDQQQCSVCGSLQYDTPSGVTCANGHGGAPSM